MDDVEKATVGDHTAAVRVREVNNLMLIWCGFQVARGENAESEWCVY